MKAQDARFHPGIEFYATPNMGVCGVQNDELGNQLSAQYLSPEEVKAWAAAWVDDKQWVRVDGLARSGDA